MSNNDDDLDLESGLGHDPLEWLQDDEEVGAIEQPEVENAAGEEQATPVTAETAEQVTASDDSQSAQEAEEATPEIPESAPAVAESTSSSSQQSFRYENHKAFLTVPEKLAIQIIEPMHSEWKTLLYDLPQSIEIDASNTKEVDTAGLQLLYSIVQQLAFKGSDVVIVAIHPALQRQITLFGLSDFFAQYEHAA